MDREQDGLQFLGLFGIYKESFKIVYKWRKIFSQISLTLILPFSFIFLADIEVSDILITKGWVTFWLFIKAAYLTSTLIFGLLSTSAVVYTIACVYSAREITFRMIMSEVPRVWKRVMITFLCTFLAFFLYGVVGAVLSVGLTLSYSNGGHGYASVITGIFFFLLTLYSVGLVYMTITWQLAGVVSVLEETKGVKALIKSKKLLRGNMWVVSIISFKIGALAYVIQFSFQALVVDGWVFGIMGRIGFGVLFLLLLLKLILFSLVIQTVLYLVCRSYQYRENIDKSTPSDHHDLDIIYLGDYDPLEYGCQLGQV